MYEIGQYGANEVQVDVQWPYSAVFPDQIEKALKRLKDIFRDADRRWIESQTIRLVILPILEEILSYKNTDISETNDQKVRYNSNLLQPDFIVSNDCVIEAKKIKTPLLAWSQDSASFSNAIDQGLTYLDNYNVNYCIITNGWDWYLFSKNHCWNMYTSSYQKNYFGVRFRLDEIASTEDKFSLEKFMSIFNASSVSGNVNQSAVVKGCTQRSLKRNMYETTSQLYFKNFSSLPITRHGSGFRWSAGQ